jgi:hypothetical protein
MLIRNRIRNPVYYGMLLQERHKKHRALEQIKIDPSACKLNKEVRKISGTKTCDRNSMLKITKIIPRKVKAAVRLPWSLREEDYR